MTNAQIADELARQGYTIDKKKIGIDEPIKSVGNYVVTVKLYPEISAKLKIKVTG